MTPESAHSVVESVRWLLDRPGADVTFTVNAAPLAPGQTVTIAVRAYVPDEVRGELVEHVGLVAYPQRHMLGAGQ